MADSSDEDIYTVARELDDISLTAKNPESDEHIMKNYVSPSGLYTPSGAPILFKGITAEMIDDYYNDDILYRLGSMKLQPEDDSKENTELTDADKEEIHKIFNELSESESDCDNNDVGTEKLDRNMNNDKTHENDEDIQRKIDEVLGPGKGAIYKIFPAMWTVREKILKSFSQGFNVEGLEYSMDLFIKTCRKIVYECRNKPNKSFKFRSFLANYMFMFKLYSERITDFSFSSFYHKMAMLMGCLFDVELRSSTLSKELADDVYKRLYSVSSFMLNTSTACLEAVLYSDQLFGEYACFYRDICVPLLKQYLFDKVSIFNEYIYVKHILVFKLLKTLITDPEERNSIIEKAAGAFSVSADYLTNLKDFKDVLPSIPTSQKDNITKFLLLAPGDLRKSVLSLRHILEQLRGINLNEDDEKRNEDDNSTLILPPWYDFSAKPISLLNLFAEYPVDVESSALSSNTDLLCRDMLNVLQEQRQNGKTSSISSAQSSSCSIQNLSSPSSIAGFLDDTKNRSYCNTMPSFERKHVSPYLKFKSKKQAINDRSSISSKSSSSLLSSLLGLSAPIRSSVVNSLTSAVGTSSVSHKSQASSGSHFTPPVPPRFMKNPTPTRLPSRPPSNFIGISSRYEFFETQRRLSRTKSTASSIPSKHNDRSKTDLSSTDVSSHPSSYLSNRTTDRLNKHGSSKSSRLRSKEDKHRDKNNARGKNMVDDVPCKRSFARITNESQHAKNIANPIKIANINIRLSKSNVIRSFLNTVSRRKNKDYKNDNKTASSTHSGSSFITSTETTVISSDDEDGSCNIINSKKIDVKKTNHEELTQHNEEKNDSEHLSILSSDNSWKHLLSACKIIEVNPQVLSKLLSRRHDSASPDDIKYDKSYSHETNGANEKLTLKVVVLNYNNIVKNQSNIQSNAHVHSTVCDENVTKQIDIIENEKSEGQTNVSDETVVSEIIETNKLNSSPEKELCVTEIIQNKKFEEKDIQTIQLDKSSLMKSCVHDDELNVRFKKHEKVDSDFYSQNMSMPSKHNKEVETSCKVEEDTCFSETDVTITDCITNESDIEADMLLNSEGTDYDKNDTHHVNNLHDYTSQQFEEIIDTCDRQQKLSTFNNIDLMKESVFPNLSDNSPSSEISISTNTATDDLLSPQVCSVTSVQEQNSMTEKMKFKFDQNHETDKFQKSQLPSAVCTQEKEIAKNIESEFIEHNSSSNESSDTPSLISFSDDVPHLSSAVTDMVEQSTEFQVFPKCIQEEPVEKVDSSFHVDKTKHIFIESVLATTLNTEKQKPIILSSEDKSSHTDNLVLPVDIPHSSATVSNIMTGILSDAYTQEQENKSTHFSLINDATNKFLQPDLSSVTIAVEQQITENIQSEFCDQSISNDLLSDTINLSTNRPPSYSDSTDIMTQEFMQPQLSLATYTQEQTIKNTESSLDSEKVANINPKLPSVTSKEEQEVMNDIESEFNDNNYSADASLINTSNLIPLSTDIYSSLTTNDRLSVNYCQKQNNMIKSMSAFDDSVTTELIKSELPSPTWTEEQEEVIKNIESTFGDVFLTDEFLQSELSFTDYAKKEDVVKDMVSTFGDNNMSQQFIRTQLFSDTSTRKKEKLDVNNLVSCSSSTSANAIVGEFTQSQLSPIANIEEQNRIIKHEGSKFINMNNLSDESSLLYMSNLASPSVDVLNLPLNSMNVSKNNLNQHHLPSDISNDGLNQVYRNKISVLDNHITNNFLQSQLPSAFNNYERDDLNKSQLSSVDYTEEQEIQNMESAFDNNHYSIKDPLLCYVDDFMSPSVNVPSSSSMMPHVMANEVTPCATYARGQDESVHSTLNDNNKLTENTSYQAANFIPLSIDISNPFSILTNVIRSEFSEPQLEQKDVIKNNELIFNAHKNSDEKSLFNPGDMLPSFVNVSCSSSTLNNTLVDEFLQSQSTLQPEEQEETVKNIMSGYSTVVRNAKGDPIVFRNGGRCMILVNEPCIDDTDESLSSYVSSPIDYQQEDTGHDSGSVNSPLCEPHTLSVNQNAIHEYPNQHPFYQYLMQYVEDNDISPTPVTPHDIVDVSATVTTATSTETVPTVVPKIVCNVSDVTNASDSHVFIPNQNNNIEFNYHRPEEIDYIHNSHDSEQYGLDESSLLSKRYSLDNQSLIVGAYNPDESVLVSEGYNVDESLLAPEEYSLEVAKDYGVDEFSKGYGLNESSQLPTQHVTHVTNSDFDPLYNCFISNECDIVDETCSPPITLPERPPSCYDDYIHQETCSIDADEYNVQQRWYENLISGRLSSPPTTMYNGNRCTCRSCADNHDTLTKNLKILKQYYEDQKKKQEEDYKYNSNDDQGSDSILQQQLDMSESIAYDTNDTDFEDDVHNAQSIFVIPTEYKTPAFVSDNVTLPLSTTNNDNVYNTTPIYRSDVCNDNAPPKVINRSSPIVINSNSDVPKHTVNNGQLFTLPLKKRKLMSTQQEPLNIKVGNNEQQQLIADGNVISNPKTVLMDTLMENTFVNNDNISVQSEKDHIVVNMHNRKRLRIHTSTECGERLLQNYQRSRQNASSDITSADVDERTDVDNVNDQQEQPSRKKRKKKKKKKK